LIVGGTGGIGLASARRFLEEGVKLVISGRSQKSADFAKRELGHLGDLQTLIAELSDAAAMASLVPQAVELLGGRLDILFHVAGQSGRKFGDGPLESCSNDGWDTVLDTNARSVFLTNRAAVQQMLTQTIDTAGLRGTVLNVGSVLGWSPSPVLFNTFAYAAAKSALRGMTLNAAASYAPQRIRFNLLAPALIDTPMATRAVSNPTYLAYLQTKQPMTAGPGSSIDCAEAALYLCEPASRFITGAILEVDGGWHIAEGQHGTTL
jgi:NAD(P)-dependent dehydrogenase (short-subunit alcohol dehydrogenase family)